MNSKNAKPCAGQKFTNVLVSETPIFDGRRKHKRPVAPHSGNVKRDPKWIK